MTEKSKILVRIEQELHDNLKLLASNDKRSVNSLIVNIIEEYVEKETLHLKEVAFHKLRKKMIYSGELTEKELNFIEENEQEFNFFFENSRLMTMEERINNYKNKGLSRDVPRSLGSAGEGMSKDER